MYNVIPLNFLSSCGCQVLDTKAQIASPKVKCLGLTLTPTNHSITTNCKAILRELLEHITKQQVLSFLGLANFFCLWIPNFTTLAQPLHQASSRSPLTEPLEPVMPMHVPFHRLKETLLRAPALTLPNPTLPFILYTTSQDHKAVGVLGHQKGPSFQSMACLS